MSTRHPLDGVRIVVTRADEQGGRLVERLEALGADVVRAPAIVIEEPDSWNDADRAITLLRRRTYSWALFASANAVRGFGRRMGSAHALGGAKVAAVGPATAAALRERGIEPALIPATHTAHELGAALGSGSGKVLWPRAQDAPRPPVDALTRLGWDVDEVAVYKTVMAAADSPGMEVVAAGEFDIITFASPSAVRSVSRVAPPQSLELTASSDGSRMVACIGPTTADEAGRLGYRVDVVASEHSTEGLVDALVQLCATMAR